MCPVRQFWHLGVFKEENQNQTNTHKTKLKKTPQKPQNKTKTPTTNKQKKPQKPKLFQFKIQISLLLEKTYHQCDERD